MICTYQRSVPSPLTTRWELDPLNWDDVSDTLLYIWREEYVGLVHPMLIRLKSKWNGIEHLRQHNAFSEGTEVTIALYEAKHTIWQFVFYMDGTKPGYRLTVYRRILPKKE